ncbi:MAG: D-alanine--D-alanine ligase family protein [Acidimicrobiia bacterium]|nr:MAG: D-alanine--D-alanine ligase family protein [Acidimicrobiia bacterium]
MARVLLLFGGRSAEHEVSCASAVSVHDALVDGGHRVIPVGIDRDGTWHLADPTFRPFKADGRTVEVGVPSGALRVVDHDVEFDVVFPVLHGPQGEDGTVQGLLETCGVPYVGCGVLGSSLAMDKDLAKRVVKASGIETTPWVRVTRDEWDRDPSSAMAVAQHSIGFPAFVKPSAQGSSIGVRRVENEAQMNEAVNSAFRYDSKVLIERAIDAREIEVGVLDGPRASVPGEVIVETEFYTYDAKYADESSRFEVPAQLSESAGKRVRILAENVFTELGLSGLARVDFLYDRVSRRFLFNEANTLPGFTSISGFPKMWLASGMTYPELCSHLVEAAFTRHKERSRLSIR